MSANDARTSRRWKGHLLWGVAVAVAAALGYLAGSHRSVPAATQAAKAGSEPTPPSPPRGVSPHIKWLAFTPPSGPPKAGAKRPGGKGGAPQGAYLGFDGKEYDPPLKIEPVERTAWRRNTPEEAYRGFYTASRKADVDWILEAVEPAYRDQIRKEFNEEGAEENARRASRFVEERVHVRVNYGAYALLVVELRTADGQRTGGVISWKRVGDEWFITRDLDDDPLAGMLWHLAQTRYGS